MFCVKSFVAAVFSLCILRGQTLPPVHTMSAPIDLHASSEICCLFSSLPPQFSENMRYIEQKKSLASSVGIYNILTSRLKNCVCLSLPNFSLTKAHFLFLCLSLSFSLVTVFGAARFSVVSPDEYSFVSCVSLYTPSYQRPKVVSPPHPLTHHTVCLSFLPTWQLIFLFLLLSPLQIHTLDVTSPREAICVALKHIKRWGNTAAVPPDLDRKKAQTADSETCWKRKCHSIICYH